MKENNWEEFTRKIMENHQIKEVTLQMIIRSARILERKKILELVPEEIPEKSELEIKSSVPLDVLMEVKEFLQDPQFRKGWNQCRDTILKNLTSLQ